MSDISVITAVHQGHFLYLSDAYDSLCEQNVDWEWVVQVDGEGDPGLPDDPRIRIGRNRPSGPGPTRNMALALTATPVVRTLDADDALLPGALARDLNVLASHPEVGWCVSPALDLHPDGSRTRWDHDDPPPGVIDVGWVEEAWVAAGHLPVLPSTMAIRRNLLASIGGWMALPTSEDTGLLIAASTLSPGWFHEQPGNLYRKHDGQLTRSAGHLDPVAAEARKSLIIERAAALRHSASHPV